MFKLDNINIHKLNYLKFNPFQTNNDVALSQHNTNLDKSLNINEIDCNYYLPTEFITKSEKHFNLSNAFSIMHLNIRSIRNKFNSFKYLTESLMKNINIIGLTETWLSNNDCEEYYKLEGYVWWPRTATGNFPEIFSIFILNYFFVFIF